MEPEQIEEVDDEKIIYEWSPPTGQKQEFFYKGYPITREQVQRIIKKSILWQLIKVIRSIKCLIIQKLENVEDIKKKYTLLLGTVMVES